MLIYNCIRLGRSGCQPFGFPQKAPWYPELYEATTWALETPSMQGLIGPSASVARQPYGWPPLFAWHPAMLPRVERGAPFPPAPPMVASVPICYFPCLMSRWAPGFSFLYTAWLTHSHTLLLWSQSVCLARGQIPGSCMGLEPPGLWLDLTPSELGLVIAGGGS